MKKRLSYDESRLVMQVPKRLHHAVIKRRKRLSDICLHKTQVMTLMILKSSGCNTMVNLGQHVGMEKGSFTQVIDKLHKTGYVRRERDPNDRRSVKVSLTEKGIEITNKIAKDTHSELERIFSVLEDDELKLLIDSLKNIERIVNKIEEYKFEEE